MQKTKKTSKAVKPALYLIEKHSYVSLMMPDARFTTSFSGERASGRLAQFPNAFKAMCAYVNKFADHGTFGEAMKSLTDEKKLSELWPEWNNVPVAPIPEISNIKVGDEVTVPKRPDVGQGRVYKIDGKKALVLFTATGRTSVPVHMLQKVSTVLS